MLPENEDEGKGERGQASCLLWVRERKRTGRGRKEKSDKICEKVKKEKKDARRNREEENENNERERQEYQKKGKICKKKSGKDRDGWRKDGRRE